MLSAATPMLFSSSIVTALLHRCLAQPPSIIRHLAGLSSALIKLHGLPSRQVPLLASTVQTLTQTVAVFLLAYLVAPTIATRQQQLQLQLSAEPSSYASPASTAPVPLQCGLRPEHSALLPCRPLALLVLLGLAMVAWPVWLSWA